MSNLDYLCKTGSICFFENSFWKIEVIHELGRGKYSDIPFKIKAKISKETEEELITTELVV